MRSGIVQLSDREKTPKFENAPAIQKRKMPASFEAGIYRCFNV